LGEGQSTNSFHKSRSRPDKKSIGLHQWQNPLHSAFHHPIRDPLRPARYNPATPTRQQLLTQIPYYGYDPADPRNNRTGLIAWGVILIVIGSFSALFGFFTLASLLLIPKLNMPPGAAMPHTDPRTLIMGLGVYLVVTAVLITVGVGSCRARRWVRPIIIIATTFCIYSGTLTALFMILQIASGTLPSIVPPPRAAGLPAPPISQQSAMFIGVIIGIVFTFIAAIVIPGAMLYFYSKSTTREKLAAIDPAPNWTDRLPIPALGWTIGCLLAGLSALAATFGGFAIFFGRLLTGPAAIIQLSITGILFLIGAWLCYTRPVQGWRLTITIVALLALSSVIYAIHGDPAQFQQLMAAKLASYGVSQTTSPTYIRISSTFYYLSALAYGIYVRRWFSKPTP
jgi:hypothetical protein